MITKNEVIARQANSTAAGVTAINGATIDLEGEGGCNGVLFICCMGTLTATQVTQLKAQSSPDGAAWTDIAGATTAQAADGDSNKMLLLEVAKSKIPARYIRSVVLRSTANAVIDAVIALSYNAAKVPVVLDSTVSQALQAY